MKVYLYEFSFWMARVKQPQHMQQTSLTVFQPMAESSANGEVNTRQTEQLDLPERPKKKKKRKPKL